VRRSRKFPLFLKQIALVPGIGSEYANYFYSDRLESTVRVRGLFVPDREDSCRAATRSAPRRGATAAPHRFGGSSIASAFKPGGAVRQIHRKWLDSLGEAGRERNGRVRIVAGGGDRRHWVCRVLCVGPDAPRGDVGKPIAFMSIGISYWIFPATPEISRSIIYASVLLPELFGA